MRPRALLAKLQRLSGNCSARRADCSGAELIPFKKLLESLLWSLFKSYFFVFLYCLSLLSFSIEKGLCWKTWKDLESIFRSPQCPAEVKSIFLVPDQGEGWHVLRRMSQMGPLSAPRSHLGRERERERKKENKITMNYVNIYNIMSAI